MGKGRRQVGRVGLRVDDVAEHGFGGGQLLGAGGGDAKLLAGGHSLIPALKLRIARPEKLVDIGRLSDLAYVKDGGTHIAIGALRAIGIPTRYVSGYLHPKTEPEVRPVPPG